MTRDPHQRRVKDVFGRDIVCVQSKGTVREALALMVENRVATLPVVDKRGNCQGVLSATDVVELAQELDDGLRDFGRSHVESPQWLLDKLAEHDMDRRSVLSSSCPSCQASGGTTDGSPAASHGAGSCVIPS